MSSATFSPRQSRKRVRRIQCAVSDCLSIDCEGTNIRFHRLPLRGKSIVSVINHFGNEEKIDRLDAWKRALKIKDESPLLKICSLHFTLNDYHFPEAFSKSQRHLKMTAVPTCNLPGKCSVVHKARLDRKLRRWKEKDGSVDENIKPTSDVSGIDTNPSNFLNMGIHQLNLSKDQLPELMHQADQRPVSESVVCIPDVEYNANDKSTRVDGDIQIDSAIYSDSTNECNNESVGNCDSGSNENQERYYRFPKDEDLITKWISASNIPPEARPKVKNLQVCLVHFKDSDYKEIPAYLMKLTNCEIPVKEGRRILADAVPSQYLLPPHCVSMNAGKTSQKSVLTSVNEQITSVARPQPEPRKNSSLLQPPKQILQILNQNQTNESACNKNPESLSLKHNENPCHLEHNYCQFGKKNPDMKDASPNPPIQILLPTNQSAPIPVFLLATPVNSEMMNASNHISNSTSIISGVTASRSHIINPMISKPELIKFNSSSTPLKITKQGNNHIRLNQSSVTPTTPVPNTHTNNKDKPIFATRQTTGNQPCKPDLCGSTSCELRMKKALRAKDVVIQKLINTIKRLKKARRSQVNAEIRERLQHIFSSKQIQKMLNPGRKVHWSEEDITSATYLKNISSKAYKYLRAKNYPLPGLNVLALRGRKIDAQDTTNVPKSISDNAPT